MDMTEYIDLYYDSLWFISVVIIHGLKWRNGM